ncbi:MAG: transglycosylase domain-containing protein [Candidatus Dormibacterales bacterium]
MAPEGPIPGRPMRARASQGRLSVGGTTWHARARAWVGAHRVAILGAVAVVLALFAVYVWYTLRDLPSPGETALAAGTITFYDRHGQVIERRSLNGEYHIPLPLSQMGHWAPIAVQAAEDRHFYHEGAIDWAAELRAAVVDLRSHSFAQGGSTITQQLVKIQLLTPQKSILRKLQEAILAEALARRYSKDQVLAMYLNRVYFGHGAYGIGSAARTYFDEDAAKLTIAQAAFLGGLIQAPSAYDPEVRYDLARDRQLYVLGGMVKMGAITPAQSAAAGREDIRKELRFTTAYRQSKAPQFVDYVMGRLEQQLGAAAVQQGGFSVYTTLDLRLQQLAQHAVASGVGELNSAGTGVNNGDLMAADSKTGAILAWVGSADYRNSAIAGQYDVILSPRSPGSSFKPYDYEAALRDRRITLATRLDDSPNHDFGYKVVDFDNQYMGRLSARRALVLSRNIPAVQVAQEEGMSPINDLMREMTGWTGPTDGSLCGAIGCTHLTMLAQVQGYQVFADQGTKVPLMSITKVVDGQGNTVYQQTPGQQDGITRLLSPAEAYLITDTLKQYQYQWGLGFDRQMASKSGTSGGSTIGVHQDAWQMAYNPEVVIGTWGGNTAPNGGGKSISAFGVNVGLDVESKFVNGLPQSWRGWYPRPSGIVDGHGCAGQPDASHEIFLAGTQNDSGCASPPRSSPSPSPSAGPSPSPTVSPPPSPTPSVSPSPLPSPTLSPAPTKPPGIPPPAGAAPKSARPR